MENLHFEMTDQTAPTYTQIDLFSEDNGPRAFEVSDNLYGPGIAMHYFNEEQDEDEHPTIELMTGDKIYPYYVERLILTKID